MAEKQASNHEQFDTVAINASIDIYELVSRYIPLTKNGKEYKGLCPFHDDTNPSFYVAPQKNLCGCFRCNMHESPIGFLMAIERIEFVDACKRLTGQTDYEPPRSIPPKTELKKKPPRRTFAPPAGTAPPDMEIKARGLPIKTWEYKDRDGATLGFVARYHGNDEAKTIRVWSWGNHSDEEPAAWSCAHFAPPRPLYGMELLDTDPEAQVMLVEGEKTADAARLLFPAHIVLTWPGGANAIAKADWTLLKGRNVILMPDADEVGRQAMERIAAYLHENGAEVVRGIDTSTQPDGSESPKGWDLADAVDWTPEIALNWARARRMEYRNPDSPQETAQNAPEAAPAAPDIPSPQEPATDAPTARIAKPELGIVDGNTVRKPKRQEIEPEPDLPPEFSESGMAQSWVDAHGEDWRYTAKWRAWHRWDGTTWALDEKNSITWLINQHCTAMQSREMFLTGPQRNRICSIKNFNAINTLAGSNPRCAIVPDDWDADPFMLGTPGGIIDLRTGELIAGTREQLISRKTSATPQQGPHPWWDSVLSRAHKGNPEVAAFIHRWCGYILTGDTREERFLFIHGKGGAGKSKFLTPLVEIMGDYCRTAKIESFTANGKTEHSEEVARLAGARLVTASETEDGARWNESRIKQLTGRDKIAARHMHQSTFEFQPQFKLVFIGNHKPGLRSVGEEMRRRIDLLEWSGSIPQEDRILDLPERLKLEYPAILHWMIQGAQLWLAHGLGKPPVIEADTDEYLTAEDTLGTWLDDCITLECGEFKTLTSELYDSFKRWADQQGEFCPSQKKFSQKLEDRGFERFRNNSGRYFLGLSVKPKY